MSDFTDRVPQLLTTPILIGIATPFFLPPLPQAVVAGLATLTFAPSDLAQYYRQIHASFLMLNEAVAQVKSSPCWTPEATENWRDFRNRWIKFYSQGPSKWWTVLKGDKSTADDFARGLVWWSEALGKACGQSATAPVQAPVSNPFFLQPLPAADPEVVAAVQLKHDNTALDEAIKNLGLETHAAQWFWWGVGATAAVSAVLWSTRKR